MHYFMLRQAFVKHYPQSNRIFYNTGGERMGYSIDYQSGKKRSYGQYRWKFIPIVLLFLSLYLRLMQPQIHRFMKDILISEGADVALEVLFSEKTVFFDTVHTFCDELFIP
jgi:hypothetical protein